MVTLRRPLNPQSMSQMLEYSRRRPIVQIWSLPIFENLPIKRNALKSMMDKLIRQLLTQKAQRRNGVLNFSFNTSSFKTTSI